MSAEESLPQRPAPHRLPVLPRNLHFPFLGSSHLQRLGEQGASALGACSLKRLGCLVPAWHPCFAQGLALSRCATKVWQTRPKGRACQHHGQGHLEPGQEAGSSPSSAMQGPPLPRLHIEERLADWSAPGTSITQTEAEEWPSVHLSHLTLT